MMRILITGTNGYIGNYLSKSLNYDITCLHRDVCDLLNPYGPLSTFCAPEPK